MEEPIPAEAFELTAEELSFAAGQAAVTVALPDLGPLPLDPRDPASLDLMAATSARSLTARGLLRSTADGGLELDAGLSDALKGLAAASVTARIVVIGAEGGTAEVTLGVDRDDVIALNRAATFDYRLYRFTALPLVDVLTTALERSVEAGPGGTVSAALLDDDGVAGIELAWSRLDDTLQVCADEGVPVAITPLELARRVADAVDHRREEE